MSYTVEFTGRASKDIDELPASVPDRALKAVAGLQDSPRPPGSVPVKSAPSGNYRLRVGAYRIGYEVDDEARVVTVWQVGDRRDFYGDAKRRRK